MLWIERQKNFIGFTLSSLLRRKGKNAALVVVYTLIVFVLASVMFFSYAVKKEAFLILQDAPEIMVQRVVAGRQDLVPESYAARIAGITGVSSAKGRLWGYYYDTIFHANYTLLVPEDFYHAPGNIVIGSGVSRTAIAQEDNIMPFWAYDGSLISYRVAEVLPSESEMVSSDLILLSEADFRRLSGIQQGSYTDISVSVRNVKEIPVIAEKIKKQIPDSRPITRDEILRTYNAVFSWRGGIMLMIFSGAVTAFFIFAWDKASGLSAEEKKEIGILKATGWETSDVLLMKFWEGVLISLSSFLAGLLLAYVHVFFTSAALFSPVLKGWSVLYPEFRLVPFINSYQVATLFSLTVIPYTVATLIPSWRAATVDPDAVMRG
ncbi:MAG: ABC transporter permease [Thermodesulfovibrionales bacterium]